MGLWIPASILLKGSSLVVAGFLPESQIERDTTENWPAFTLDTSRELAPHIEAYHDCIVLGPGENCVGDTFELNYEMGIRFHADRLEIDTETGKLVTYNIGTRHWFEIGEPT